MEYTTNGCPFVLPANASSEVTYPMEDAIFHTIVEFLLLDDTTDSRRALIAGRDINNVVRMFQYFF